MSKVRTILAMLLACICLTGCQSPLFETEAPNIVMQGGNEAVETKPKSFAEIAKILKEFGIDGITDDLIREMGDMYDDIPPDALFNRTAAFLLPLGEGVINWDTMEWTPAANGVYCFDAEVFDVEKMYTNFLLGVSAIGGDELVFTDIQENTEGVNWEEGTGTRTVSFVWNENTYTLEAESMGDWFDPNIGKKLNQIIIAENTGKQLFFASDGYQGCIVFYRDQEWAASFQEQTGLSLSDAFFGESL